VECPAVERRRHAARAVKRTLSLATGIPRNASSAWQGGSSQTLRTACARRGVQRNGLQRGCGREPRPHRPARQFPASRGGLGYIGQTLLPLPPPWGQNGWANFRRHRLSPLPMAALARLSRIMGREIGENFVPSGVVHCTAVAKSAVGAHTLLVNESTPKCPDDLFMLHFFRATADALVHTGANVRDEPEFFPDWAGQAWTADLDALRRRLGKAPGPPPVVLLTSGRCLPRDRRFFREWPGAVAVRPSSFPPPLQRRRALIQAPLATSPPRHLAGVWSCRRRPRSKGGGFGAAGTAGGRRSPAAPAACVPLCVGVSARTGGHCSSRRGRARPSRCTRGRTEARWWTLSRWANTRAPCRPRRSAPRPLAATFWSESSVRPRWRAGRRCARARELGGSACGDYAHRTRRRVPRLGSAARGRGSGAAGLREARRGWRLQHCGGETGKNCPRARIGRGGSRRRETKRV